MKLDWVADRDDPRVREALRRPCPICRVEADRQCVDPFGAGAPLADRVIHWGRHRPDLKRKK